MNAKPANRLTTTRPDVGSGILARLGQIALGLALEAAILCLAVGRLDWLWAWVFLGIYLVAVVINGAFLMRTSPETIAERGHGYQQMKRWDKSVSGMWSLAQFILLPLVAGLDIRFGWTRQLDSTWHLLGSLAFAGGLALFGWAMIVNAYFSTVVRIQGERGHSVCRSGPYHYVRHPGYVGANLQSLAIPFLLGSLWALLPALAAIVAMVIRTALEDRTLQAELPGYREYAHDVRFRLIPGIW